MKSKRNKPLVFTDLSGPEPSTAEAAAAPAVAADPAVEALLDPAPEAPALDAPAAEPIAAPIAPRRTAAERKAAKPPRDDEPAFARHAYVVAVLAALVWAGGLAAFVAGFQTQFGAFEYSPIQWVVIGLLAILPATFMLLSAFALRQGAKLAGETRRARALADDLAVPAALAADQTGGALEAMRREIEKASEAARAAREPIAALREALTAESRRLSEAAIQAQATGRLLTETLGRERTALNEMAGSLQLQAADAAEALARQAKIVADASDLAQAQLEEAQASLTARAADLAVAAGDARHAAQVATQAIGEQIAHVETTSATAGERLHALVGTLVTEREQLSSLAYTVRADQEDLSARFETQRAQLAEAAEDARSGAQALSDASDLGAEALRNLIVSAAEEVRRLAETAHREQMDLDAQAREAVSLFSGVVAEERAQIEAQTRAAINDLAAAAEEARRAAAEHVEMAAEAARAHADAARVGLDRVGEDVASKIDSLGEAAFAAAQKADQVFDNRIAVARRMIEQSAQVLEETGDRSVQRIEQGLASARASLSDMDGFLAEIDKRMAALPEEARTQAAAVREAVEAGVGDLTAAARRAAAETQAIDAAFQERVRRNYEVLSDAVRLMGRVAGAAEVSRPAAPVAAPAPTSPALKTAAPVIRNPVEPEQAERAVMPERIAAAAGDRAIRVSLSDAQPATTARTAQPPPAEVVRPAALTDPFADLMAPEPARDAPAARRADPAGAAGLRPRLKLTPAPEPAAPVQVQAQAPSPAAPRQAAPSAAPQASDEWTWKGLLTSMDEPASDDDEAMADRMISEIGLLGIDAGALLPRARIDEIAAALQAGDASGAREVVRRLAPAAIRRLSRRVLTDKVLRTEADRYVRRYEELLQDSARKDREGYMMAALLGSDPGRAFLLLDAAVGDLH
jgi:hypothetical protein